MRQLFRSKWRLIWAIGFLIPVLWSFRLLLGRPSVVQPSSKTTFLTGDTLSDGSLDFSSALWKHCNSPVPADDNAAIALRNLRLKADPSQQLFDLLMRDTPFEDDRYIHLYEGDVCRHGDFTLRAILASKKWRQQEPVELLQYLAENSGWLNLWTAAVRKPSISKPVGMTINDIREILNEGTALCLLTALHHARQGRWDLSIALHAAADQAADQLTRLQCGWMLRDGFALRNRISRQLTEIAAAAGQTPPELAVFVEDRLSWPVVARLTYSMDNALRIQYQTNVRDFRNPNNQYLRNLLQPALLGSNETHEVQLRQLRNAIDWTRVSEIQNIAIDELLAAIRSDPWTPLSDPDGAGSRVMQVGEQQEARVDYQQTIAELRQLDTSNLSEFMGWMSMRVKRDLTWMAVQAASDTDTLQREALAAIRNAE